MRWEQGRADVDRMLIERQLQRVPASRAHADQGLRPTTSGGHRPAYDAVSAQLDPPMDKILRPFDRMRRQRHRAEYPALDAMPVSPEDIDEELPKAAAIVDVAKQVLDQMSPF